MFNKVLGIGLESSCDETAVAIVADGRKIVSHAIFSQIKLHQEYFGVVPEIASRAHLEVINDCIDHCMKQANLSFHAIDYVAATCRPGLVGSLLIALQSAKAISYALSIPLIGVHHLEAHLYAPFLEGYGIEFPFIGLLVSGGNTALYLVHDFGKFELLGNTTDDAVGEAFDKVAKFLLLGYPGGPIIETLAQQATVKKQLFPKILADSSESYSFSYSGIKTAVIQYIHEHPDADIAEIAYSFQERALEILARRLFEASRRLKISTLVIAGGVASNKRLREIIFEKKKEYHKIFIPSPILCTDNGAMVAGIGYQYFKKRVFSPLTIDVKARA
ncbi:MAG TPA: tRNA (adenosine(37)-N6)-threonylcarbamoyltransferase complex transferase subunit TsaD [Spirochaetota bacterium]|nr:tRNA (adenosine(37)-N6)-threonylcarbamoyltransferase complex transferase subunit TsaD [Spirochaetota bacterium]